MKLIAHPNLVVNNYGECPIGAFCEYDLNGDCVVDGKDEVIVRRAVFFGCDEGEGFMGGSEPISDEQLEEWFAMGGQEAVENDSISAAQLDEAFSQSTSEGQFEALVALLNQ